MDCRRFDVVLYGAAGFTGRQAVRYFAQHADPGLKWALAGPSRDKLETARAAAGREALGRDILVADSRDQASVDALVAQTNVVLNTAGPFAWYSTPVVDACVRFGTQYADITGETQWVCELITRYHDVATRRRVRIVNFCGFDSVPSDLGAFLMARHIRKSFGIPCVEICAYFQMYGGFNGGTVASIVNMLDSHAASDDAFLLDPLDRHSPRQIERSRDLTTPYYDKDVRAIVGPFFMAHTNARVVRRSAALYQLAGEPYGPEFVYQEGLKYDLPFARAKAWITTNGLAAFNAALKRPALRRMLSPVLPKPGTGPSDKTLEKGWFTCELIGFAEDGRQLRGFIRHSGDPGNRATVKFVCEAAMALAGDLTQLPGGTARGGVLTPATGVGNVLADRLRHAGVTIDIGEPMTHSPVGKVA